MHCYFNKQKKALTELVAQENKRLEPQGLFWTYTPPRINGNFLMCLHWRPEVRPGWEAANPSRRPISREPLPAEFYSPELKMAVAMAQVQASMHQQGAGAGGVQMVPMYGAGAGAEMAPGAQPVQGYGQPAWEQPPQPPAYPVPASFPPGGSPIHMQAAPLQQSMGDPSSPSAVAVPAPPWSPSAPAQQPQWSPPSHEGNTYAAAAPANTPEGSTSPQQRRLLRLSSASALDGQCASSHSTHA